MDFKEKPQPVPRVEEIARQIANSIIGPLLHAANNGKKISLNFLDEVALETEAVLRPYFPPASQTPQIYGNQWFVAHSGFLQFGPCSEKTAKEIVANKSADDLEWEAVEYRPALATPASQTPPQSACPKCGSDTFYVQCNRCDYDFMGNVFDVFLAATPASTARTDGWVSVKNGLPKVGQWCWVVYHGVVQRMAAHLTGKGFACADGYEWSWAIDEADPCPLEEITHWQPFPAAPGSVPQAPDPLKDDSRCAVCCWPLAESVEKGCVRGNCSMRPFPEVFYDLERAEREYGKRFGVQAGVPQAEPPKEEKP